VFLAKHYGGHESPGWPMGKPISALTTQDHHHEVAAHLINLKGTERRHGSVEQPTPSACAQGNHLGVVSAFVVKYHRDGGQHAELRNPAPTVDCEDRHALISVEAVPAPYLTDEQRAGALRCVRFLQKYGVLPQDPSATMVLVKGMPMVDIGMRMLEARELFNAQGFPPDYIIDRGLFVIDGPTGQILEWRPLTKTSQIRMCGNSVCPPVARALVLANHVVNDNRTPLAAAAGD
jgi:DNA (cytosine-5)-methyltransferase 1